VPEGKTYCSACSRLRRGSLYGFAKQIGATKIALGHHRDDMLATFFLNLFHGGALKSMPPKLLSDDKQNLLIRPLAYVEEKDIIEYAKLKEFQSFLATYVAARPIYSVPLSMTCYVNGMTLIRSV